MPQAQTPRQYLCLRQGWIYCNKSQKWISRILGSWEFWNGCLIECLIPTSLGIHFAEGLEGGLVSCL